MEHNKITIDNIDIAAFGGMANKSISLGGGVNLISAPNEGGKSTLIAAIMFALYGFRGRSQSVLENPKKKYMPWSGAAASGALTLGGDKRLRIQRSVQGNKETASCTDLVTGASLYTGAVFGEEVLGISAETFEKTSFFSTLTPPDNKDEPLAAMLQNLMFSADEQVSGEKAVKSLNAYKNSLKGRSGSGLIPRLETEEQQLEEQLVKEKAASAEYDELQNEIQRLNAAIAEKDAEAERAEAARLNLQKYQAACTMEEYATLKDKNLAAQSALENAAGKDLDMEHINRCRAVKEEEKRTAERCAQLKAQLAMAEGTTVTGADIGTLAAKLNKSKRLAITLWAVGAVLLLAGVAMLALSQTVPAIAAAVLGAVCGVAGIAVNSSVGSKAKGSGYSSLSALNTAAELIPIRRAEQAASVNSVKQQLSVAEAEHAALVAKATALDAYGDIDAMFSKYVEASKLRTVAEGAATALADFEKRHDTAALEQLAVGATVPEKSAQQIETEYRFATQGAKMLRDKLAPKQARLQYLNTAGYDPAAVETALIWKRKELAEAQLNYNALLMAIEELEAADNEMKASISPRIATVAGKYFAAATGGKYTELELDTRLFMSYGSENGIKSAEYLSAGTRDAAYLCLRLALVDMIHGNKKVPLVLDDAFGRMDNTRLKALMAVLCQSGHQLIITSCNGREERAIKELGVDYTAIQL